MGRMKENPRYNVISLRVSDEEMEALEQIVRREGKPSMSDLLRGVITGWLEVAR